MRSEDVYEEGATEEPLAGEMPETPVVGNGQRTAEAPGFDETRTGGAPGFDETRTGAAPGFDETRTGGAPGFDETRTGGAPGVDEPRTGGAAGVDETPRDLFDADEVDRFRVEWREIQARFVDDPQAAVRGADQLVAEVMDSLTETFNHHKRELEEQWQHGDRAETEDLRQALRRYRSFFDQLLHA